MYHAILCSLCLFLIYFDSYGYRTQGLVHARQVLSHRATCPVLLVFLFFFFLIFLLAYISCAGEIHCDISIHDYNVPWLNSSPASVLSFLVFFFWN
jgi:hypothetical protein